jgi:hypothetical protein
MLLTLIRTCFTFKVVSVPDPHPHFPIGMEMEEVKKWVQTGR